MKHTTANATSALRSAADHTLVALENAKHAAQEHLVNPLSHALHDASDHMRHSAEKSWDCAVSQTRRLQSNISAQPLIAVGAAFALGVLAVFLLQRR